MPTHTHMHIYARAFADMPMHIYARAHADLPTHTLNCNILFIFRKMLPMPRPPNVILTDYESSGDEREELQIDVDISSNYDSNQIELARKIFTVVLDDWMYGYKIMYTINHYMPLFVRILELVSANKVIDFLLPGFPVKSPNIVAKVLGSRADFAEFLAIRCFIVTARKIQAIYVHGVTITVMSDYHTFDQYIGTTEEAYNVYHSDLKEMIRMTGSDDIIKIISLASFPEFENTISTNISTKLNDEYGNSSFLENFDQNVKSDSNLLERYKQMLKFMQKDQQTNLPGSPRSRQTRKFLKDLATGMMSQGIALDSFLKEQNYLSDYIRISIHHHHPKSGKFAIDLFKQHTVNDGILRTPWHHTVMFDTMKGEFIIDHKHRLLENPEENSFVFTVTCRGKTWFLIRIFFKDISEADLKANEINITMIKDGCGIILENKSNKHYLKSQIIDPKSLTSMIKEFGVVVLRGFSRFKDEEGLYNFYYSHGDNGIVPWKFGPVHKVKPAKDIPGFVNEMGQLPIHWDMILPPPYMGISQTMFNYEDFTCREFLLYCQRNSPTGTSGGTAFVDSYGVVLSLHGKMKENWKNTLLVYESRLTAEANKSLYFGGTGNTFEYPLIQYCPWTKKDVLRWCQYWNKEEDPNTTQLQMYTIKSSPNQDRSVRDLEKEIQKIAFDKRFFFEHTHEEGDQVFVNNYTMLHGRLQPFTNKRELWRVQLVPPSDNIPEYFHIHGKQFFTAEY